LDRERFETVRSYRLIGGASGRTEEKISNFIKMKKRLGKKIKSIPKFRSREEEREFWDTHDTTEYFDEQSLVKLAPHIKDFKLVHVYVGPDGSRWIMIPEEMKKRKAQIAVTSKTAFLASINA